jgi:hypothetical protein
MDSFSAIAGLNLKYKKLGFNLNIDGKIGFKEN